MAATSHDFWLKNLSASAWKRRHMLVDPASALLIAHIALGALQRSRGVLAPALACLSLFAVVSLHLLITGLRELRRDRGTPPSSSPASSPALFPRAPGRKLDRRRHPRRPLRGPRPNGLGRTRMSEGASGIGGLSRLTSSAVGGASVFEGGRTDVDFVGQGRSAPGRMVIKYIRRYYELGNADPSQEPSLNRRG